MEVKTGCFARYKPEMGLAVRITVWRPKRFKYPYVDYLALAPFGLMGIVDEDEFARRYRAKLEKVGAEAYYKGLAKLWEEEGKRPLILLCYERYPTRCHRGDFALFMRETLDIVISEV
jgi:hypothetical protein